MLEDGNREDSSLPVPLAGSNLLAHHEPGVLPIDLLRELGFRTGTLSAKSRLLISDCGSSARAVQFLRTLMRAEWNKRLVGNVLGAEAEMRVMRSLGAERLTDFQHALEKLGIIPAFAREFISEHCCHLGLKPEQPQTPQELVDRIRAATDNRNRHDIMRLLEEAPRVVFLLTTDKLKYRRRILSARGVDLNKNPAAFLKQWTGSDEQTAILSAPPPARPAPPLMRVVPPPPVVPPPAPPRAVLVALPKPVATPRNPAVFTPTVVSTTIPNPPPDPMTTLAIEELKLVEMKQKNRLPTAMEMVRESPDLQNITEETSMILRLFSELYRLPEATILKHLQSPEQRRVLQVNPGTSNFRERINTLRQRTFSLREALGAPVEIFDFIPDWNRILLPKTELIWRVEQMERKLKPLREILHGEELDDDDEEEEAEEKSSPAQEAVDDDDTETSSRQEERRKKEELIRRNAIPLANLLFLEAWELFQAEQQCDAATYAVEREKSRTQFLDELKDFLLQ